MRCWRLPWLALALALVANSSTSHVHAAVVSKANNTTALNVGSSWIGGTAPGTADIAQWDNNVTGANSSVLGANLGWQGVKVTNPGGAVTLAAAAGATLSNGSSGVDMSGASANLTMACALNLASAQSWNVNSGRTLTVSGTVTGSGALTKSGTGKAVLSANNNTFSGDIILNGGVLSATVAAVSASSLNIGNGTALGRLDPARTITVNNGAVLTFTNSNDVFCQGGTSPQTPAPCIAVDQGGVLVAGHTSTSETGNGYGNNFGKLTLNGGTLRLLKGYNVNYGAAMLTDRITVGGLVASSITSNGMANSVASLGYSGSTLGTTFDVANVTGDAATDLTVSASLRSAPNIGVDPVSLTKVGTGTLLLSAVNGYSGTTVIGAGTLALGVAGSIPNASGVVVASGATFDVSVKPGGDFTFTPGMFLSNNTASGTALIQAGGTVTLSTGAQMGFTAGGGADASLGRISINGNLVLNGNPVTVSVTGGQLPAGTYRILDCSGSLTTNGALPTPTITGGGMAMGSSVSLSVVPGAGGHVDLVVTAPWTGPLVLERLSLAGNALVAAGSNGPANRTYQILFSTNVAKPRAEWAVVATNVFDANGNFTCTNMVAGSGSGFYQLVVTQPSVPGMLAIRRQPRSQEGMPGQNMMFNFLVTGLAPISYQWYFGTNLLTEGTNAYLLVRNAQTNLAGSYHVIASNSLGVVTSAVATLMVTATPAYQKPRIIATTDGEVDDRSTMVRFLTYACDFDVAGIIQVNSRYQKNGHSGEHWVEAELDQYEKARTNLVVHNPDYPDANYLRSLVRVGNETSNDLYLAPMDMGTQDTPGSQLIIDTLLDSDPRPVHVPSWGGANTTAFALWRLADTNHYTPEQFAYAVSRIRIYCIWYQDGGGGWIQTNIPGAYINEAYRWDNVWDYQSIDGGPKGGTSSNPSNYTGTDANLIFPAGSENTNNIQYYMGSAWLNANVKVGHGPLGAYTPQTYISEGDTPSFLNLINNGLRAYEDYTLGGWGGRSAFGPDTNTYPNHLTDTGIQDDGNNNKMYWRWIPAAQNDFAARMDWCVAGEYAGANHQPLARVDGSLARDVSPGETVSLDASPSTDPDGDNLHCTWWQYYDNGTSTNRVDIINSNSLSGASFVVPSATNQVGTKIHVILQVTDEGSPPLTSYQRIICTIR